MTRLVVNADDFGRTDGIVEGTLEAHLSGIVTSATAMILEKSARRGIAEALRRAPRLSLGLHFVLTGGGPPASSPSSLPTLAPEGRFVKNARALPAEIPAAEVRRELEAQIALFTSAAVGPVFAEVAAAHGLPARAASPEALAELRARNVPTPDVFLEDFYGEGATADNLLAMLAGISAGTAELMCHPGHSDPDLAAGSSYASEREREIEALCDPRVRALLAERRIDLVSFDDLRSA